MEIASVITIALTSLIVWRQAIKDFSNGVSWTVFFLAWLPHGVRIETGGALPEFTVHRILLLILIGVGVKHGLIRHLSERVPMYRILLALFISYSFSVVFAIDVQLAFKRLFYTLFENYLLYIAIVVGVERGQVEKILKAALLGVLLIAVLGPVEYYTGHNVIGKILPVMTDNQGVISSYQHSIHYGYAMAMAVPLATVFACRVDRISMQLVYLAGVAILMASCYFSRSRGALIGAIMSLTLLVLFGGQRIRKMAFVFGIVVIAMLVVRPGLRETIYGMVGSVFEEGGKKDASADYRRMLWKVAWFKVNDSPTKLLFGMGGASTMLMDISEFFDRGRGGNVMKQGYSSWDSQWAANLVQYGFSGFLLEIAFWLSFFWTVGQGWRRRHGDHMDGMAFGVIVGCSVYLWAMLTVAMFTPQLKYLVSTFIGCGMLMAERRRLVTSETPENTEFVGRPVNCEKP